MIPIYDIYNKINTSDIIIYPSEVRHMFDNYKKKNPYLTQQELSMIEIALSFYNIGFDNRRKSKPSASP